MTNVDLGPAPSFIARPMLRAAFKPALLAAGLITVGVVLRWASWGDWTAQGFDPRRLPGGAAGFATLAAITGLVGLPRQVIGFAAGYAFGTAEGLALALAAETATCAAHYGWARAVGAAWMERRGGPRLARVRAALLAQPFGATLTIRLLPVGSNIATSLLAGVWAIPAVPFLLASAIGYVPQTIVFALLGGGVRVDRTTQIGVGVALFALSAALGAVLLRRERRAGRAAAASDDPN